MPNRTYTATAEAAGCITDSPKLQMHKKGLISLMFFRAGMFKDDAKYFNFTDDDLSARPSNRLPWIPQLSAFRNYETILNEGFLYIIDDKKPGEDHYEYQVQAYGVLSSIIWAGRNYNAEEERPKDIRIPLLTNTTHQRNVQFPKDKVIWVAYSPIQWTYSYFKKQVEAIQNGTQKRMEKIVCAGIKKESTKSSDGKEKPGTNQLYYRNFYPTFNVISQEENLKKTLEDGLIPIHQYLVEICNEEAAETKKWQEKNDLYEDMFIILDDEVGCARDIAWHLEKEHHRLDALLESIQTGENSEHIFQRNMYQIDHAVDHSYKKDASVLSAMAAMVNFTLFSEAKAEIQEKEVKNEKDENGDKKVEYKKVEKVPDKYKNAAARDKINKILGTAERCVYKTNIENIRKSLEDFLKTTYCQQGFEVYTENGMEALFEGRTILLDILNKQSVYAHDKDLHFTLPQDVKKSSEDVRLKFLNDVEQENGEYPVYYKILNGDLDIGTIVDEYADGVSIFSARFEKKYGFNVAYAFFDTINTLATEGAKLNYTDIQLDKKLKSIKYHKKDVIYVNRAAFDEFAQTKLGFVPKVTEVPNKKGNFSKINYRVDLNEEQLQLFNKKKIFRFENGKYAKLDKFANSAGFKGFFTGLELLNLIVLLRKENKTPAEKAAVAGSSFMLASAATELSMLLKPSMATKAVKIGSKALGYVGAGINLVVSSKEAIDLYNEADYDAAALSGVAALGSLAMLVMIGMGLSATPIFIVGIIVFLIGVIAIFLMDDDMEKFLFHSVIGSKAGEKLNADSLPYAYIQHLCSNRNEIITKENFYKWRNFENAYRYFNDFLPSFSTRMFVMDGEYVEDRSYRSTLDVSGEKVWICYPTIILVQTKFNQFLLGKSQFTSSLKFDDTIIRPYISSSLYLEMEKKLDERYGKPKVNVPLDEGSRYVMYNNGDIYIENFYVISDELRGKIMKNSERMSFEFQASIIVNPNAEDDIQKQYWPMIDGGKKRYLASYYKPYIERPHLGNSFKLISQRIVDED